MKTGNVLLSICAIAVFCVVASVVKASPAAPGYGDIIVADWRGRVSAKELFAPTADVSGMSASRPWPKWLYNEWREGSDDTVTRYAEILSENAVRFRTHYGAQSRLAITLRSGPDGNDVILTLSKGRFACARSRCQIVARFDNGAILGYSGIISARGSADAIFLSEHPGFIQNISKADSLVIRAELEQEGTREFAFDTVGLRWP